MNLRSFSAILHPPASLCPSVCPQCFPRLSALGFINNENVVISVSLFRPLSPPFFPPISTPQPFMSPRYPGGPRPSLRMPNQVLEQLFITFLTHFFVVQLLFRMNSI